MNPPGKHPNKSLSAVRVKALKIPGRYGDGNGLYLVVEPSENKHWVLRIMVQGRRRDIGLGGLSTVSLAEARDQALSYRKLARDGLDPIAEKRAARRVIPTFSVAANKVHTEHSPSWKNPKHASQWINSLTQYAFPFIGDTQIDVIDTPEVLKVLAPIWLTKPETARRVRQRIGTVLDWGKASGFRSGDNPVDGVTRGLPKQTDKDQHHKALPYSDVPDFITKLRAFQTSEAVRLGFEFTILTATRTSEVLDATWDEVDEKNLVWTIPATRMKASREHRVPLAPRCIEILESAKKLSDGGTYIFPGRSGSGNKPLSNMAFLEVLKRMKLDVTTHGFRSSFRDWTSEQTNFPRDVCEMALAHTIKDKVEAAYRRGDLFEKRRDLMTAWVVYCDHKNTNARNFPSEPTLILGA